LIGQYKVIREELKQYSEKLTKKKEIVVFNKIDLLEEKEKNEKLKEFKKFFKKKFYEISILKKENINTILRIL
jgi:GTP-binding protein